MSDHRTLAPGVILLGSPAAYVYLLLGQQTALIDTGMAWMGPSLVEQLRVALDGRPLDRILLTHSHFDHLGGVSHIAAAYPGVQVHAHRRVAAILERPNAVALIARLNDTLAAAFNDGSCPPHLAYRPFALHRLHDEGDRIDLGWMDVIVVETPGHTRDSVTYHVPSVGLVVTGEAAGVPKPSGGVSAEFLVDYEMYMDSMRKIEALEPSIIGTPHVSVVEGRENAIGYLDRSRTDAEVFRALLLKSYEDFGGDLAAVEEHVVQVDYSYGDVSQPPEAYRLNLRAMIAASLQSRRA